MKKITGAFLALMAVFQINAFAQNAAIVGVSSSSHYREFFISHKAQYAIDGDSSTYWMCSETETEVEKQYSEKYLQLDLGEQKKITAVELSVRPDAYEYERSDFELRLSNSADFENYVRVPCVITTAKYPDRLKVGAAYAEGETYRKEIDLPDKYRYVRYVKLYDKDNFYASINEIKVETDEATENEENINPEDFKIDASFKDAVGDKTNVYIKNSDIVFAGNIKNNTNADTQIYCIAAAYNSDGTLSTVDITESTAAASKQSDFKASLNLGTDTARVSGYVFKKNNIEPLCEMYDTVTYYTQNSLDIFVSQENGDDANEGTILKPYKTLAAAETKAQSLKSKGAVSVNIKNGEYFVTETFVIEKEGNGSGIPITYKGFGNEETMLSGGTKITDFAYEGNGIYSANVNLEYISDIYVDDERRYVASSKLLVPQGEAYDTTNNIYGPVVSQSLLGEDIEYVSGMEIFYPAIKWRSYTYKLQNITSADGLYTLEIVPNDAVKNRAEYEEKDLPTDFDKSGFYLRNSKQLLDEEGEWYFDKSEKKLYYIPYADEAISECEIYASGAVDTIIRIENGKYYRAFENLTFAHTGWELADKNGELRWLAHDMILPAKNAYSSGVHGIKVPGALQTSYGKGINVKNCIFKHTGGVGLVFNGGMNSCEVSGNVFYDIADSAMYLGHYNVVGYPTTVANKVNISNNVITATGRKYSVPALTIYGTKNTSITHNDISDCPYSGIFIGAPTWNNTLADATAEHDADAYAYSNNVSYNKIHEICKKNVDGAGIYTVSHNHGTVISNNYIKNQYLDYSALYNDDGSACYTMYNNVSENVPGWLYHWNDEILFINAYDNYSTTNEVYVALNSSADTVEDVNIFSSNEKPEEVNEIIANAGLESEYAKKLEKYIPDEPKNVVSDFEAADVNAKAGVQTMLNAGFSANDSGRYRWKAIGSNASKVTFKSFLTGYWKKGMQFDKIYATFSAVGTYEVVCEADDGRGYIYANKITVTVE